MKPPKTTLAKILKALIEGKKVSLKTFVQSGLRARISQLKLDYGLRINSFLVPDINEFGRTYNYAEYSMQRSDVKKAKELYEKLNK